MARDSKEYGFKSGKMYLLNLNVMKTHRCQKTQQMSTNLYLSRIRVRGQKNHFTSPQLQTMREKTRPLKEDKEYETIGSGSTSANGMSSVWKRLVNLEQCFLLSK